MLSKTRYMSEKFLTTILFTHFVKRVVKMFRIPHTKNVYNLLPSLSTAAQWVEINSKVELSLGYKRVQKYLDNFNVQVEKNNMKSIRKATSENIHPIAYCDLSSILRNYYAKASLALKLNWTLATN